MTSESTEIAGADPRAVCAAAARGAEGERGVGVTLVVHVTGLDPETAYANAQGLADALRGPFRHVVSSVEVRAPRPSAGPVAGGDGPTEFDVGEIPYTNADAYRDGVAARARAGRADWRAWKGHLIECAYCTAGGVCAEGRRYLGSSAPDAAPWLNAASDEPTPEEVLYAYLHYPVVCGPRLPTDRRPGDRLGIVTDILNAARIAREKKTKT